MNLERRTAPVTAFGIWLRTGRRVADPSIEVKFNPWHDPNDGRFTFAGQGRYFPRGWRQGNATGHSEPPFRGRGGSYGGGGASGGWGDGSDPRDPGNHSVLSVRAGDTLGKIAARRKGLRVSDLARLNNLDPAKPLRIGQTIKVPHQAFLDRGRDAKNRFVALSCYMRRNNGRLPPDPANPPSLQSQVLDADWRRQSSNGYDYQIDIISRTRLTYGQLSLAAAPQRSRRNQAQAGRPDRLPTDDGAIISLLASTDPVTASTTLPRTPVSTAAPIAQWKMAGQGSYWPG